MSDGDMFAKAVLIAEYHPEVDCVVAAYRHLHEQAWDVPAPDVSTAPHA